MNYIIDIIDTKNDAALALERAVKSSIILDWKGGDLKDELGIIGSSLDFTMLAMNCEDGQYYDLFTGDETRFKVRLYNDLDVTLWSGFILPDSYTEPYQDSPIPVQFTATDGLGRIKGKYLPDNFYKDEQSVTAIIGECLRLTGLDLDFRLAPAIENSQNKDYSTIYIDTAYYLDNDKKEDAYSVLKDLLASMLCVIYQADNIWNIEGLNIREKRVYTTKTYNLTGTFINEQEITRLHKDITGIATPEITMQPPYGVVNITHKREPLQFQDTIAKEENDGWVYYGDTFSNVYATEWVGKNGFYAYGMGREGDIVVDNVYFGWRANNALEQLISIKKQPYVQKGKKYKLVLNFELIKFLPSSATVDQDYIDQGYWTDPFLFLMKINYEKEFGLNGEFVAGNLGQGDKYHAIEFNIDRVSENEFYFIPGESGLLDIILGPVLDSFGNILVVKIDELTVEELAQEEEFFVTKQLNENYTLKKDIDLFLADDMGAFSKAFRLEKLKVPNQPQDFTVPILRSFPYQGFNYYVVDLQGANLIADNIDTITDGDQLEVIYNYAGGQEHVIKTALTITGSFTVQVSNFNSVIANREYWEQWTDSLYKIEKVRYAQAALNIYNRMFDIPVPSIQNLTVKNNVKLNDFINFTYRGKKDWILTNCKWNLDTGFSSVTAIQAYYGGTESKLPVVELGSDIYFEGAGDVQLTSDAYSPEGFIVSHQWTEITSTQATILSPITENTGIQMIDPNGIPIDYAVFQLEVTDNNGLTAKDTISIYRVIDLNIQLTETYYVEDTQANFKEKHFQLEVLPGISDGSLVNIKGTLTISKNVTDADLVSSNIYTKIKQQGNYVSELPMTGPGNRVRTADFSINYLKGDDVLIEFFIGDIVIENIGSGLVEEYFARIELTSSRYIDGTGTITGVPATAQLIFPAQ